jgi:hypothetical protein
MEKKEIENTLLIIMEEYKIIEENKKKIIEEYQILEKNKKKIKEKYKKKIKEKYTIDEKIKNIQEKFIYDEFQEFINVWLNPDGVKLLPNVLKNIDGKCSIDNVDINLIIAEEILNLSHAIRPPYSTVEDHVHIYEIINLLSLYKFSEMMYKIWIKKSHKELSNVIQDYCMDKKFIQQRKIESKILRNKIKFMKIVKHLGKDSHILKRIILFIKMDKDNYGNLGWSMLSKKIVDKEGWFNIDNIKRPKKFTEVEFDNLIIYLTRMYIIIMNYYKDTVFKMRDKKIYELIKFISQLWEHNKKMLLNIVENEIKTYLKLKYKERIALNKGFINIRSLYIL